MYVLVFSNIFVSLKLDPECKIYIRAPETETAATI